MDRRRQESGLMMIVSSVSVKFMLHSTHCQGISRYATSTSSEKQVLKCSMCACWYSEGCRKADHYVPPNRTEGNGLFFRRTSKTRSVHVTCSRVRSNSISISHSPVRRRLFSVSSRPCRFSVFLSSCLSESSG